MNKLRSALDEIHVQDTCCRKTEQRLRQERERRTHRTHNHRLGAALVCACLLLVLGVGGYSYAMPVSYISMDVNPSIELALNCYNRVVSVQAYNDDGETIAQQVSVKGLSYTQAIDKLLEDEAFAPYLKDDAALNVTIVSDHEEKLAAGVESCSTYQSYGGECHSANREQAEQAHEAGMSVGKYAVYEQLNACDSSITVEDCHGKTMRELRDWLAECSGDETQAIGTAADCRGNGSAGSNGNGNGNATGGKHQHHGETHH